MRTCNKTIPIIWHIYGNTRKSAFISSPFYVINTLSLQVINAYRPRFAGVTQALIASSLYQIVIANNAANRQ